MLATTLTIIGVTVPTGSAAAPSITFGFNAFIPSGDANATANLNRQKALGNAPVRRLFIFWNEVQPTGPNQWQWGAFDTQYQQILKAGLIPEITLHGAPCWASPTTRCQGDPSNQYAPGLPDPAFTTQWKRFVSTAVHRYPQAAAVEIWNEANLNGLNQAGAVDPVAYTRLLQAAYRSAKTANAAIPVLGTGVSANLPGYGNWESFLDAMLSNGAANYMDGLGLHTYPVVATPGQLTWSATEFGPILDSAESIQTARGSSKPLWITEAGCGATVDNPVWRSITPDQQASDCVSMLNLAASRGDVRAMYVNTVDDVPADQGYGWVGALGVYNPDVTPKPAACAISTLLGGSLHC